MLNVDYKSRNICENVGAASAIRLAVYKQYFVDNTINIKRG